MRFTTVVAFLLLATPMAQAELIDDLFLAAVDGILNTNNTDTLAYAGEAAKSALTFALNNYNAANQTNATLTTLAAQISKIEQYAALCAAGSNVAGDTKYMIEKIFYPIIQRLLDELKESKKQQVVAQYPVPPPQQPRNSYATVPGNAFTYDFIDVYQVAKDAQKQNLFYTRK